MNCKFCKKEFIPKNSRSRVCYSEFCQRERQIESLRTMRQKYSETRKIEIRTYRNAYRSKLLYDLTASQITDLYLLQSGKCKICNKEILLSTSNKMLRACIDHDHSNDKVRGLLCQPCNTMLGHFNEDIELLERVISYLKKDE